MSVRKREMIGNWLLRSVACALLVPFCVFAEETESDSRDSLIRESKKPYRITVVGSKERQDEIAGSAYLMDEEEMEEAKSGVSDIHRILRRIPGVNIQEEEGYGLRPNIGLRGAPAERSSSITLMEDGVLIAPAPYSAPAAYYFPNAGRMEGIEVLKGASTIKYGPHTTGGSLNMLSTSIPDDERLHAKYQLGSDRTQIAHVHAGKSWKHGGVMLETFQARTDGFKELDGGGDTGFDIEDYVGKIRLNTDRNAEFYQEIEFKFGIYDQKSDETYMGLTEDDFNLNPFRRYTSSQLDRMVVDHRQFQLTHYAEIASNMDLTTTAYTNETARNWTKIEGVDGNSLSSVLADPDQFAEQMAWIRGEADSPEGVFNLRGNNRRYTSTGIQSVLGTQLELGETDHDLQFGVRYHEDYEDRFQAEDKYKIERGRLLLSERGAPGSNANRKGSAEAWAFYVQDEIAWDKLTVTPGLRYETIDFTRRDWGKEDPNRTGENLSRVDSSVDALIPGIGVHYKLTPELGTFLGVHRGFSPPGPSSSRDVDKEESINYEVGANYRSGALRSELVYFFNDYDNLLGSDLAAAGGTGSGDLFNAGEAQVQGIEAQLGYDLGEDLDLGGYRLPARLSYTYTNAEFRDDFDSSFYGLVRSGDHIPYIPDHQLALGLGLEHDDFSIRIESHYVDAMRTNAGQAGERATERTDSHFVFDLHGEVPIFERAALFASVHNLFDEEYIVARRPAGVRPGAPRLFFAGVKVDL